MMTITKEQVLSASDSELDEMVALAQGWEWSETYISWLTKHGEWVGGYHPSINGSQCMGIMQREKININFFGDTEEWGADDYDELKAISGNNAHGKTAMIAICRCFVLSKLEVLNEN